MPKKKIANTPAAPRTARRRIAINAAEPGVANGNAHPTHNEIAEAAYHRYLNRHGAHGSEFDDWLEAERELRARWAASSKV